MIIGNETDLTVLERELPQETVEWLQVQPDPQGAMHIAVRWLIQQPQGTEIFLRELGQKPFAMKCARQWRTEQQFLNSEQGQAMLKDGLAVHEILQLSGVEMNLNLQLSEEEMQALPPDMTEEELEEIRKDFPSVYQEDMDEEDLEQERLEAEMDRLMPAVQEQGQRTESRMKERDRFRVMPLVGDLLNLRLRGTPLDPAALVTDPSWEILTAEQTERMYQAIRPELEMIAVLKYTDFLHLTGYEEPPLGWQSPEQMRQEMQKMRTAEQIYGRAVEKLTSLREHLHREMETAGLQDYALMLSRKIAEKAATPEYPKLQAELDHWIREYSGEIPLSEEGKPLTDRKIPFTEYGMMLADREFPESPEHWIAPGTEPRDLLRDFLLSGSLPEQR